MNKLDYPKLKNGVFVANHYKDKPLVRKYIVENEEDLNTFLETFTNLAEITTCVNNLKNALDEGRIIILTDNTIAGFPSYCFESKETYTRK